MASVKLSESAFRFAKQLVGAGRHTLDERDDWSEHQPTSEQENAFIDEHGYREYGRWHLGRDDEHGAETKAHYRFPYGDFQTVHRCGVLAAESRAAQRDYADIESAAAHLHGMLDGVGANAR
jgi:hypothetical protein